MRGEQPVAYYWAHFTGSLAETLVEKCRFANQKPLNVGVHGSIAVRFESVFRDFIERDACFEVAACAGVVALLTEIARRAETGGRAPVDDERISRAIAHLHRSYSPVSYTHLTCVFPAR